MAPNLDYHPIFLCTCISVYVPDCPGITAECLQPVIGHTGLEALTLPDGVGGGLAALLRPLNNLEHLSVSAADLTGQVELPGSLGRLNIRGEIPPYIQIYSRYGG